MSADKKKVPSRPESPNAEPKPEEAQKKSGMATKTKVKAGPIGNNQDGPSSGVGGN
jgi:hypothetical protein